MDDRHFDAVIRLLGAVAPRRAVTALLGSGLIGALSALGLTEADAKKKRKKKKKKCPKPAFCSGKNKCIGTENFPCQSSGDDCSCFVAAETGTPFCGNATVVFPIVDTCSECPEGSTCIYASGAGCGGYPFLCAEPCPDPL